MEKPLGMTLEQTIARLQADLEAAKSCDRSLRADLAGQVNRTRELEAEIITIDKNLEHWRTETNNLKQRNTKLIYRIERYERIIDCWCELLD